MAFYERKDKIISLLRESDTVSVNELSQKLYISKPTLRRDLIKLEKKGVILRTHGGARLVKGLVDAVNPFATIPFAIREAERSNVKMTIAKKAVSFIKDGYTIMLDATTSAYYIIPYLADFKNIIVITSCAKSSFLLGQMGIKNICTGGNMIPSSFSYVGNDALATISNYNADIVFFSCAGLGNDGLLSDNSIEENMVRKAMIKQSKKKVFLCDSKKIGNTYLNNLCHLSEIDEIISEKPIPEFLNVNHAST